MHRHDHKKTCFYCHVVQFVSLGEPPPFKSWKRPLLLVAGLFRLIDSIKAFPLIYVLTNGGPGTATQVTNYYAFTQAFNYAYWGYASAIAVLLTAGVFVLSWLISGLSAGSPTHD
jgi:multiple sugar transport system permease protein